MFKYLCTYQQIPPSFLSCLYSFRRSHSAQEWCNLPQFNDDNTLLSPEDDILPLDRMGLSGREIRYSFVLRSVESSTSVPNRSWGVRQLAVYHSFDIKNGQSFWVTCKGNSLNEELFQEALAENKCLRSSVLESVPQAFSSSLEVLTMLIDWCDDDWIFYINELFDAIKPLVDKARTPAIKDESALTKDVKIITGLAGSPSKRLSHMTSLESGTSRSQSDEKEDPWGDLNDRVKRLERLEVFSFDELQKLQQGLETIQEALLVLKLNSQVIRQIREHYQCLMTQYRLPALKEIKKGCEDSFLQYCRHSRNIEANIDAHQAQLNALLLLVKESKEMVIHSSTLRDSGLTSLVQYHSPIQNHSDQQDLRRERSLIDSEYGEYRQQDQARDELNAYHHFCDSDFPPWNLHGCTSLSPWTSCNN